MSNKLQYSKDLISVEDENDISKIFYDGQYLASFSINWNIWKDSFITVFSIILNEGTDVISTIQYLSQKYSKNIFSCLSYSNIPKMITLETWAKTAQESQKIQKELQTEGFKNITPYIAYTGDYYNIWVDQLLRTK